MNKDITHFIPCQDEQMSQKLPKVQLSDQISQCISSIFHENPLLFVKNPYKYLFLIRLVVTKSGQLQGLKFIIKYGFMDISFFYSQSISGQKILLLFQKNPINKEFSKICRLRE